MLNFGERLNSYIKKTGLTVDEFSKKIQFSRAQVYRYLKNETDPPISLLQAIKNEFPWIDVEWLATGNRTLVATEELASYGKPDPIIERINQYLDKMIEEDLRAIEQIASKLAQCQKTIK